MLSESDADALSLRALARKVGVSAPSVYRHFPSKEALLSALAREGLARMADMQREAASTLTDPAAAFVAAGRAYARFAIANPSLFRLIFASSAGSGEIGDAEAFQMLRDDAAATMPKGADAEAVEARAARAWAVAHGLSMLMLDGLLPKDEALIEATIAVASPRIAAFT